MSHTRPEVVRILYKSILRLHRGLPQDVRQLGDAYVKDEFKRHKNCSDAEAHMFLKEWSDYAFQLNKQLCVKNPRLKRHLGQNINPETLDELREDQVVQLYELMKSAKEENTHDKNMHQ